MVPWMLQWQTQQFFGEFVHNLSVQGIPPRYILRNDSSSQVIVNINSVFMLTQCLKYGDGQ